MINEQYKTVTGTEKSTTSSSVDTGGNSKTERGTEGNDRGSQQEVQGEGLAGLTPDQKTKLNLLCTGIPRSDAEGQRESNKAVSEMQKSPVFWEKIDQQVNEA